YPPAALPEQLSICPLEVSSLSRSAALARLGPCQKLLEQPVALCRRGRRRLRLAGGKEFVELVALGLRRRRMHAQPFFRALEPLPARQHRCEIGLAPFRMPRGLLEFCEPRKERFDELLDAPVAIGIL